MSILQLWLATRTLKFGIITWAVLPFLTSLEDSTLSGAYDGASPAGCSFQVDGGTSKRRCDQAQTAQRLWAALFTTLHLRGFDTNWKQNLFCHKRRSSTHRESVYGWLSTDLVIHEDDWQHERRHEWRDKKERSKETRHRSATCTLH